MRISDGSSDVCSSDLGAVNDENSRNYTQELRLTSSFDAPVNFMLGGYYEHSKRESFTVGRGGFGLPVPFDPAIGNSSVGYWPDDFVYSNTYRSEEHTSELQSLMRISYAVFCLKKKNKKNILHNSQQTNNTQ